MDTSTPMKRLWSLWRSRRLGRRAAPLAPDPADCGTAWGLDLSLLAPSPTRSPRTKPRR